MVYMNYTMDIDGNKNLFVNVFRKCVKFSDSVKKVDIFRNAKQYPDFPRIRQDFRLKQSHQGALVPVGG